MGLDSLKQQIRQMQELKINGIYVLNPSQRNILDDVVKKLDGFMCIPRKQLEELYEHYHGEDDSKRELIKELLGKEKP